MVDRQSAKPAIVIRAWVKEQKKSAKAQKLAPEAAVGVEDGSRYIQESVAPSSKADPAQSAGKPTDTRKLEFDILNSFFVRDIEYAQASHGAGKISGPLREYLMGIPTSARVDLFRDEGYATIREQLHPASWPRGRWLTDEKQKMSLMQQFAINKLLQNEAGAPTLFSINGPPGTGKTTLLQDVIAELVTRRAKVLAQYAQATDAFKPKVVKVAFENSSEDPYDVRCLQSALTGFEMVVASTNNAAVANISIELPKLKALSGRWRIGDLPRQSYLRPVAHKIAAQIDGGEFKPLEPNLQPWGLIAAALGNADNRRLFVQGARNTVRKHKTKNGEEEFPDGYDPLLHQSLFNWQKAPPHIPSFVEARASFLKAEEKVEELRAELGRCAMDWESSNRRPDHAAASYSPALDRALDDPRWQTDGIWNDDALNLARSELFAAALQLHESWIAEAMQKKRYLSSTLNAALEYLGGGKLADQSHAEYLWQALFMLVPVVSSTFASIARQFRDLGPGKLGWLFIDEAGQAVPQAAVGALWRSQRAVVVGDPLQIEPVFTVPVRLIRALEEHAMAADYAASPHCVSVQHLADGANRFGAKLVDEEQDSETWVGSPLRVHRRCSDPMFSIANRIAYGGKMVHPTAPDARHPSGETEKFGRSAWVDLRGPVEGKQLVRIQVDFVAEAIALLWRAHGKPSLYVISPFRQIARALQAKIRNKETWHALGMDPPNGLFEWARAQIGTVHTFQGKQQSTVWIVLGCDTSKRGAARWAANKPNLLNVAITRAEHQVVLIGGVDVWGGLPYFETAYRQLDTVTAGQFRDDLERMAAVERDAGTLFSGKSSQPV